MKNGLATAIAFGATNCALWLVILGNDGLPIALAAGLFATAFMRWRLSLTKKHAVRKLAQFDNETIVRDGAARFADGWNRTQGWLFLTGDRLVFEPLEPGREAHRFDARLEDLEAQLASGWLGRNEIEVRAGGKLRRFELADREIWLVTIQRTRALAGGEAA